MLRGCERERESVYERKREIEREQTEIILCIIGNVEVEVAMREKLLEPPSRGEKLRKSFDTPVRFYCKKNRESVQRGPNLQREKETRRARGEASIHDSATPTISQWGKKRN